MIGEILTFSVHGDKTGSLVALEKGAEFPFEIKRVYYVWGTEQKVVRGHHAHKNLEQVVVCTSGSCDFILDNGKIRETYYLDSPEKGLHIKGNVWREFTNFSPDCVVMVLASEHYNEKDYIRNYEEFLSLIRNKWNVKYAKYGASNFGQYTARRLSRHFNDIVRCFRCMLNSLSWWFRKSAIKYHKNFVSLGYNCELAYRYNLNNGFVDSGLFQWGYSCSCDDLIFALNHLDLLFTGEILDPNPLYECANTHILQHGKSPMSLWMKGGAGTSEQKEADKAELVGRIRYLKEKFVNTLHEGGALVMYKMRSAEALAPNAAEKVRTILATLKKLGAKEFDFVLVLENKCRGSLQFDKNERVYVRYVKEFNPDEDVSNKRIGDFYGWKCIFNEFRPIQKKKNAHKFKFEK